MDHSIKDPEKFLQEEYSRLVDHLSQLPHKILRFHTIDALSQMVLHELGHNKGFGLKRAIYLVDNPDFDHLIGAAGFCEKECKHHKSDIWSAPDQFSHDMQEAAFNSQVKKLSFQSLKRKDINLSDTSDLEAIAKLVGISNSQNFSWDMKHGNHGILLFDNDKELSSNDHTLLKNSAAYLSLCSIF